MRRGMRVIGSVIRVAVRVVCVLAVVAIGVLWWRSYRGTDTVGYLTVAGADFVVSTAMPGKLVVYWEDRRGHGVDEPTGFRAQSSHVATSVSSWFFFTGVNGPNVQQVLAEIFGKRHELWGFSLLTGARSGPATGPAVELAWLFSGLEYVRVGVPLWFVELLACLPSAWWGWRVLRRRRIKPGFCVQCGYDLRATPERCPECGMVVGAARPDEQAG
jgi:hypothetical protein